MNRTLIASLAAGLTMLVGRGSAAPESAVVPPVLQHGRGLDHVGMAVRDLDRTARDFQQLGFNVSPGGRFPGGLSNRIVFLADDFYLELLAAAPHHTKDVADIADFANKHEGAMFLGLNTSSAKDTAGFLRVRGFDISGPTPGSIMRGNETKPPPPMWYTVAPADKAALGKYTFSVPIFFIQYLNENRHDKERTQGRMQHANTVMKVRAVWFAVKNLTAQLKSLSDGGFNSPERDVLLLGLHGKQLAAGVGSINLLEDSRVREDRIVALSLGVSDLRKAQGFAQAATGKTAARYDGTYGKSVLIPATAAHGIAIELFQE